MGRTITGTTKGIKWTTGESYAKKSLKSRDWTAQKGLATPGVKHDTFKEEELDVESTRTFRRVWWLAALFER